MELKTVIMIVKFMNDHAMKVKEHWLVMDLGQRKPMVLTENDGYFISEKNGYFPVTKKRVKELLNQ